MRLLAAEHFLRELPYSGVELSYFLLRNSVLLDDQLLDANSEWVDYYGIITRHYIITIRRIHPLQLKIQHRLPKPLTNRIHINRKQPNILRGPTLDQPTQPNNIPKHN
jgi:hypothetical protein